MSLPNTWEAIYSVAKEKGAKFPELVAAQWALESGWGKSMSGKNNPFGLTGTQKLTHEYINGKKTQIKYSFKDFESIDESVAYLVEKWYKNFRGYFGVNRAGDREEAARLLVKEGYATDPLYSEKLIRIMNEKSPVGKAEATQKSLIKVYRTAVNAMNISQPDSVTCQAACISMAIREPNVYSIRRQLLEIAKSMGSSAGNPYVMGRLIRKYKGSGYIFEDNASLNNIKSYLKDGEFLITHGWFTNSGHVICLDGLEVDESNMSYRLDVKDPWSEFDAPSWSYRSSSKFYDGYYSSYCIYAACVAGRSRPDAARLYKNGVLDSAKQGAWVHRIKPV